MQDMRIKLNPWYEEGRCRLLIQMSPARSCPDQTSDERIHISRQSLHSSLAYPPIR